MKDFEALSPPIQAKIDRTCDAYEKQLVSASAVDIRGVFSDFHGESERRALFAELVRIERNAPTWSHVRFEELCDVLPEFADELRAMGVVDAADAENTAAETIAGSDTTPAAKPNKPKRESPFLNQYELLEELGSGAFGTVWKARDTKLQRTVAIKRPRYSGKPAEQFLREARLAAKLKHPNIVRVHEVGTDNSNAFIVTEFIDGKTLNEWQVESPRSRSELLGICSSVADALQHAHDHGIVHRDLKPTNILVDEQGQPFVTDFGLAKNLADDTMTVAGSLLGSPAYMSPEQARGDAHQADRRSDVYSLGVVLYELMTGERPFRGKVEAVIHQVIHLEPAALRTLDPSVPRDLDTICTKCLAKEPDERYQTAREFADELQRLDRGEPVHARPVSQLARALRWARRNPALATSSAVAFALLLVLAVGGPWLAAKRNKEKREATRESSVNALSSISGKFLRGGAAAALPVIEEELANGDPEIVRGFPFRHLHYVTSNIGQRSHQTTMEFIAASPTEEIIVIGRNKKQTVLWDLERQKELQRFDFHGAATFSPDGQHLAIGSDGHIRVFDVATGTAGREYKLDPGLAERALPVDDALKNISRMTWSYGGRWIAYTDWRNKHLRTLDLESGETKTAGAGKNHDNQNIVSVAFAPDRNQLASAGFDGKIRLWDVDAMDIRETHTFTVLKEWGREVCYSHDGRLLAYTDDENIVVLSTDEMELFAIMNFPGAFSLAFSPDDQYLACGNWSNAVRVWNIDKRMENYVLRGHNAIVRSTVFTPGGRLLSRGNDGLIEWGGIHQLSNAIARHPQETKFVSISAEQNLCAAVGDDALITVTDIATRKRVGELSVLREEWNESDPPSVYLDFHPLKNDMLAATAGSVVLITSPSGDIQRVLSPAMPPKTELKCVQFSPNGKQLVATDSLGAIWHWTVDDWRETKWAYADGMIDEVAFRDNEVLAVSHSPAEAGGRRISCLNIKDRSVVWGPVDAKSSHGADLEFQPHGNLLASSSRQSAVHFWDAATGKLVKKIDPDGFYVQAIAFSPDGKHLATGTGRIKLWNMDSDSITETIVLDIDLVPILGLEFSKNGNFLISSGHDDAVRIWRAVPVSD